MVVLAYFLEATTEHWDLTMHHMTHIIQSRASAPKPLLKKTETRSRQRSAMTKS